MRIEISVGAERHLRAIDDWWHANRPSAPELFLQELAAALDALVSMPLAGQLVRIRGAAGVRRVLLRSTRQHIYYEVRKDSGDGARDLVRHPRTRS